MLRTFYTTVHIYLQTSYYILKKELQKSTFLNNNYKDTSKTRTGLIKSGGYSTKIISTGLTLITFQNWRLLDKFKQALHRANLNLQIYSVILVNPNYP